MRSRTGGRAMATAAAAAFIPVTEKEKAAEEWEVRPGGMLVQKRGPEDADAAAAAPVPTIRVKVKHGAVCHEIYISSQASFGELKKVLSAKTGLHPLDMKLVYKDRERESTAFLDTAGVKDKSKVVLVEDLAARAKRLLEMSKNDKMERAAKSISAISLEVDRLASKVSALEAIVNKGGRVVDNDVTHLIDSLMNELIKLDAIVADGDVKQQRTLQIKTVQKYVETLDTIKINRMPRATNAQLSKEQPASPLRKSHQPQHPIQYQEQMQQKRGVQQPQNPFQQQNRQEQQLPKQQTHARFQQQPVVVTTNWETFDSLFMPSTSTATSATTTAASTASSTPHARFDWELF